MTGWLILLALGATARLTRLVTADFLTERPRRWVQARVPESVAYLVGCSWCASFWIGLLVGWVTVVWPANRIVIGSWLALSGSLVAGLVSLIDPREDFGD
jgi:ABC-type uncharacterized transport system permease subunit